MEDKILVAVDAVVFSIKNNKLCILLIKRKHEPFGFALPGGFVNADEDLQEAVHRELKKETGLSDIFLEQLQAYGEVKRDPRKRVITIAFLAFINADRPMLAERSPEWYPVHQLPTIVFDHKKIIEDAVAKLHYEIQTTNIASQILPKHFSLTEMQQLYEIVLERKLDKRNFRKRMNELDLVQATAEMKRDAAHRPARLYAFKEKDHGTIKDKLHVLMR